jgi:hypothetical protein
LNQASPRTYHEALTDLARLQTAVSISIYERNPRNSSLIFEGPTPPAQQGLWTYVLPLKALNHQGLLHAMLALSSLHIARLQGASITPSYKHYAYSLKRLGRVLGHPNKRHSIPTLATALLLAFYEVWTAEHTKWSTHLVGAAQLLTELDFRSLTRESRRLKAAKTVEERRYPHQNPGVILDQDESQETLQKKDLKPDENLVSTIIGKQVSYDDFGMIIEDNGARQDAKTKLSGFDVKSFETLQDLYWWYCRHDMWQSCVSGNPLMYVVERSTDDEGLQLQHTLPQMVRLSATSTPWPRGRSLRLSRPHRFAYRSYRRLHVSRSRTKTSTGQS